MLTIFEKVASEAATRGVLWKSVFLEISQNSLENTCARVLRKRFEIYSNLTIKTPEWGYC